MPLTRRVLLAAAGLAAPTVLSAMAAPVISNALPERAIGADTAKVTVTEYFSLTCTHCAAFAHAVFPTIQSQLIDTGKLRYVFQDFPLDQVALKAAMVARSLPAQRYVPFVLALFASQDRWAFNQGANATEELAKIAALAGMPRSLFDAALANDGLKQAILSGQADAEKHPGVDSTPTFVFDGPKLHGTKHAGELDYPGFVNFVTQAG